MAEVLASSVKAIQDRKKRYPTDEELQELQRQLIACQPKVILLPHIPEDWKLKGSQIKKYFFYVEDKYVEAVKEFYDQLRFHRSAQDFFN
jgi:hypothetical protein